MKINSDMRISNIAIDGAGNISKLELNGEKVELASDVNIAAEVNDTLSLSSILEGDTVTFTVPADYDGMKKLVITITE